MDICWLCTHFQTSESGVYHSLKDRLVRFDSYEGPLTKVKTDGYVYINEETYLAHTAATDCQFYVAKDRFYKAHIAFATRPDFPYFYEFSNRLVMALHCIA